MNGGVFKRSEPTDDYELLQQIGHGTYGKVVKAKKIKLDF